MRLVPRGGFDAPGTLLGGQSFRWRRVGDAYEGVALGRAWRVRPDDDALDVDVGLPPAAARRYLGLDPAYPSALARLARDPALADAVARHRGLRILRQDPWEALVAFVTSANNNVPRIEGILARLAERAGTPLPPGRHAFPTPEALARVPERDLRAAGLGYRAPFVRSTARAVADGFPLPALARRPYAAARDALLELDGVGPKVADCVCLFGLGHGEAFPVDTWIRHAMGRVLGETLAEARVADAARKRWGRDAGLAQQYLFHAARVEGKGGRKAPGAARFA